VAVSYQLVIDCASPEPLALFWAEALGLDHSGVAMADPEGNEFDIN
jgi:hypothetical protein